MSAVGLHFTAMGDLLGREASRPLPAGHLLKQDDIREVPLVRTNEICTVYSGQAGLVIRRQYKARSDGAKGQTIPMISLDSGTQILARVTGLHEAVVVGAGDALNGALGAPLPVGATQPGVIYSEEQQPRTNPAGVGPPRRFQRRPQEQLEEAGALPFPTAREGLR